MTGMKEFGCQTRQIPNQNSDGTNGLSWRADEGQEMKMKYTGEMQETGKSKNVSFGTAAGYYPSTPHTHTNKEKSSISIIESCQEVQHHCLYGSHPELLDIGQQPMTSKSPSKFRFYMRRVFMSTQLFPAFDSTILLCQIVIHFCHSHLSFSIVNA
jgi:hypothetical protein